MRHKTQENAHCPSSTQKSAACPPALCPLMSTHEPSRPAAGIPLQALVAELRSRCEAVSRFQGCSTESGGHSDGEHTRPRVFRSAPSRYGWRSGHSVNGFISDVPKDTRMSPARAPETAREGACAPRSGETRPPTTFTYTPSSSWTTGFLHPSTFASNLSPALSSTPSPVSVRVREFVALWPQTLP